MKKYLLICCLAVSAPAMAQVYKCTVNGKTAYSDSPCGAQAGTLNIRPGPSRPTEDEVKTKAVRAEETKKIDNMLKMRFLNDEIERTENNLNAVNAEKEKNLAQLRSKKRLANNNLAGATWEQSISAEMQAVATSYEGRISRLQDTLNSLRAERAQLNQKAP